MANSTKPDAKILSLANGKEAQLVGLLSSLSEELACQLAEALERDRLMGGSGLPFEAIMKGLRPKLRLQNPLTRRRIPTPERAFFDVIEGLIIDDHGEDKQQGRIARRSLDPLWRWLIATAGDKLQPVIADVTQSILKGSGDQIRQSLAQLDVIAGETIRAALKKSESNNKYTKELAAALGGARAVDDARELSRILQIGDDIRALHQALPALIDSEAEEQFDLIRQTYDRVVEKFPAGAPYIVLTLAQRVTHPWELFGIAARLVQAENDQNLKQSDLAMVGEWLVLDLEIEAASLKNLKVANFDPQRADEILRRFAMLQSGMTHEVGMRKDGTWGKRLLKARGAVSEGLEALFAGIIQELRAGLAMTKAASGARTGALVPVLDGPPDGAAIARLEAIVQFLATARRFANQLGYSVAFDKTKNEVTSYLEEFASGVVSFLPTAKNGERERALAWADVLPRIAAPMFSEEAVKILNRRIAAASVDQLQAKA